MNNGNNKDTQNPQGILHSKIVYPISGLIGFVLAILADSTAIIAGLGNRLGFWHVVTGFGILKWAAYGGIVSFISSLIGLIKTRPGSQRAGFVLSFFGLVLSVIVVGVPLYWLITARSVPPIHDITTDVEDPPNFVYVLPLREGSPNPVEYGGPEIAAKQRSAYPELKPLMLNMPPDRAFEGALKTARRMGWVIIGTDPSGGRIEATDTTFWFGFKDDIIIRITKTDDSSRIDLRSLSRVGKSDIGTNARRIEKYLRKLKTSPL